MINISSNNPLDQIDRSQNIRQTEDRQKLLEACQQFESIFISMMLKQARAGIEIDGFMEKSYARKMYEDMYDEQMAEAIAKTDKGIGLAQDLYKQLSKGLDRKVQVSQE